MKTVLLALRLLIPDWDILQTPAQNALLELQRTGQLNARLVKFARCGCWTSSAIWYDGGDLAVSKAFVDAAQQNLGAHPVGEDPIENYMEWRASNLRKR